MEKTSQEQKRFKKNKEVTVATTEAILEETKTLRLKKVTKIFEVVYEINQKNKTSPKKTMSRKKVEEKIEKVECFLREITTEQLEEYRKSEVSAFVLKRNNKLYYSEIPNDISLVAFKILGRHQCATIKNECRRLSAAEDSEGGCAKVRDGAKCIEKYPWITEGYETFNTKKDSFVVANCLHYENSKK